ncbi:VTT domain-containing protein [Phytohabitans sp. ZYX-F-186]|uniref:VTT domain-containing protein n=1 Tax=Phytohabitans maris TaxID=3071409 RepID=A0ABU0ZSC2_9ACTN|nr:VTT domain-containing protein [Phytohabitans sp. ZYX-F-186]MDQ7909651.1 VTT domain-containing protein [Phytohabitans sp. ZYX-F-186]
MHELVNLLSDLPPLLIYLLAAVLVAGETAVIVGLVVPAEATLLTVGFLAYLGTIRLAPAVVVTIAAALLGDALAFRSGRRYGPRLRSGRWGVRIGYERWEKADAMLARLGGRAMFGARWVAFVRTLAPRLAGGAGMPYRRFAPWNALGVVTWVGASVVVGFLAGESYETVSRYLGRATGAVLVLLVAVAAIVLLGRWLGRNPDPALALARRAAALPPARWVVERYGLLFFLLSMRFGPAWAFLANLVFGLALLLLFAFAMAFVVTAVVRHSGLSVVDDVIADWLAARRTEGFARAADLVVDVLGPKSLVVVVAVAALVLAWRRRAWRGDLVTLVATAGAFLPLVLLAVAERALAERFFLTQHAVVTASLCTLAWLLARRTRWMVAVAVWTAAIVAVVTVTAARLYVGWNTASQLVTSVLLGVLWTAVFMVAWATRARVENPSTDVPDMSGSAPR